MFDVVVVVDVDVQGFSLTPWTNLVTQTILKFIFFFFFFILIVCFFGFNKNSLFFREMKINKR